MPRLFLLFVAFIAVGALLPDSASAQMRVAVAPFGGPEGARLSGLVRENLAENGVTVVDWDEVSDAAGRSRLVESDYTEVGQTLSIQAFVTGRVSRARRRWSLRLSVRDGGSSERLGSASLSARNVAGLRRATSRSYERLSSILEGASPVVAQEPEQPPVQDDGSAWYERPPGQEADGVGDDDDDDDEDEEDDDAAGNYDGLRIAVTGGTIRRRMNTVVMASPLFRGRSNPDPNMAIEEDRSYVESGIGHAEIGLTAEIFPGALMDTPVLPWLGAMISFRQSLGVQSSGPGCDSDFDPGRSECEPSPDLVPIRTTQREFYIGARADADVMGNGRGLFVTGDMGFGLFQFRLNPDDLIKIDRERIIPPFDYTYFHLGAGLRYFAAPEVAIGVRAAYRAGISPGQDAKNIWGTSTGGFQGWLIGAEIEGRLDSVAEGVFIRVGVEFFRFSTTFAGPTACLNPVNDTCGGDTLWENWIGDAQDPSEGGIPEPVKDNYLRLSLSVGYAL